VSSSDGLVVLDRNGDGEIKDGSELFGSSTTLANGAKADDGYAALRELDSNGDGQITKDDTRFADLRVWIDGDSDGVTDGGELKTLQSLGITSISVTAQTGSATDNGNMLGLTSNFTTEDGKTHAAADVWFLADKASAGIKAEDAALTPPEPDLRAKVSGLAQAIGTFDRTPVAGGYVSPGSAGSGLVKTEAALAVSSMVDAMKQFDSNGSPLGGGLQKPGLSAASSSIRLHGVKDVDETILASGGGKLL
jgi:hypothetical protein